MNRQMKRAQKREEDRKGGKDPRAKAVASAKRAQQSEKQKRTPPRKFLKQVRAELKNVDWPNRKELVSYTIVVLCTVIVMTSLVAGLDYVFGKIILNLFT
jgi:preprotein translocase subunit SecE